MNSIYYKLPLDFSSVFIEDEKKMQTCNEVDSIDQYIELLLTTCPGEHKFNNNSVAGYGRWILRMLFQEKSGKTVLWAIYQSLSGFLRSD